MSQTLLITGFKGDGITPETMTIDQLVEAGSDTITIGTTITLTELASLGYYESTDISPIAAGWYKAIDSGAQPWWFKVPASGRAIGQKDLPNTAITDSLVTASPVNVTQWLGTTPLALSSQQVQAVVPNTQKVDIETIRTQSVTAGSAITILASVGTAATSTAQTGDSFAIVNSGTHGNAALKTLIDTVDNFIDTEITALTNTLGVAGAGLTDIGGFSTTAKGQIQTEAEDAIIAHRLDELLNADSDIDGAAPPAVGSVFHELMSKTAGSFTFDQTTDSNEAIRDRGDAAWTTATGFSTHSAADVWAVATRILTAATNITSTGGTTVPQTGDSYAIVNSGTFGNAALKALIDTVDNFLDTEVAAILVDTGTDIPAQIAALNNLSAAQVNSEVDTALADIRLDELLAADSDIDGAAPPAVGSVFHELMTKTSGSFTFDQSTDSLEAVRDRGDAAWTTATGFSTLTQADIRTAVGLASANLDSQLTAIDDYLDTEMAAVLSAIDTEVAAIQTAVVTSIPATLAGLMTSAMSESYRGTGATGSVAQLLYELIAHHGEMGIVATTKTTKRLDATTTAKVYTLNHATLPTAITETT